MKDVLEDDAAFERWLADAENHARFQAAMSIADGLGDLVRSLPRAVWTPILSTAVAAPLADLPRTSDKNKLLDDLIDDIWTSLDIVEGGPEGGTPPAGPHLH